jgi:hypothetical protein
MFGGKDFKPSLDDVWGGVKIGPNHPSFWGMNNPGGINWYKGCGYPKSGWYIKYPTLEQGIEDMADRLEKYYINQGLMDIHSIAAKYAPLDDSRNGKYGMDNREWPIQVTKIYNEIMEDCK